MRRTQITNILLILAAGVVGYLCFLMAKPFLVAISWAAVLAILLDPVQRRLEKVLRRPTFAAAACCVLVVLMGLLPAISLSLAVGREVKHVLQENGLSEADYPTVKAWVLVRTEAFTSWAGQSFGLEGDKLAELLVQGAEQARNILVEQTTAIVGGVAGFFFNVVVILFTLFFFLRDRNSVINTVRNFLPLSTSNANEVLHRVRDVIIAAVMGGGAVSITQGVLAGLGFAFLDVPAPLLWGVATSVFSLIPLVGAAGVWLPMTLVLVFNGHPLKAMALAAWGGLVISMVDNVLRPIIIGQSTQLHTLMIFFSILGGIQVFGFLGLVMGPVVLALGLALFEVIRRDIAEDDERRRLTGEFPVVK